MRILPWLLSAIALWSGSVFAGNAPTITFNPANPTSVDLITATLSAPDCGAITTVSIEGDQITLDSEQSECGTPPPVTVKTFGPIAAGTYQVQWFFEPKEPSVGATLVVLGVQVAATPTLQPLALLLIALGLAVPAMLALHRRSGIQ